MTGTEVPGTPAVIPADVARFAAQVLADAVAGPMPFGLVYYTDQRGALAQLERVLAEQPDAATVTVRARTAARAADAIGTYVHLAERALADPDTPTTNEDWENVLGARLAQDVLRAAVATCQAPHSETYYHPDMEGMLRDR